MLKLMSNNVILSEKAGTSKNLNFNPDKKPINSNRDKNSKSLKAVRTKCSNKDVLKEKYDIKKVPLNLTKVKNKSLGKLNNTNNLYNDESLCTNNNFKNSPTEEIKNDIQEKEYLMNILQYNCINLDKKLILIKNEIEKVKSISSEFKNENTQVDYIFKRIEIQKHSLGTKKN